MFAKYDGKDFISKKRFSAGDLLDVICSLPPQTKLDYYVEITFKFLKKISLGVQSMSANKISCSRKVLGDFQLRFTSSFVNIIKKAGK